MTTTPELHPTQVQKPPAWVDDYEPPGGELLGKSTVHAGGFVTMAKAWQPASIDEGGVEPQQSFIYLIVDDPNTGKQASIRLLPGQALEVSTALGDHAREVLGMTPRPIRTGPIPGYPRHFYGDTELQVPGGPRLGGDREANS
jgi:hypothetical protein